MAITLTVQSIVASGGLVQITATRSDNNKNEFLSVDVSSAASAVAANNVITAALTLRASQVNTSANNLAATAALIGQVF